MSIETPVMNPTRRTFIARLASLAAVLPFAGKLAQAEPKTGWTGVLDNTINLEDAERYAQALVEHYKAPHLEYWWTNDPDSFDAMRELLEAEGAGV